MQLSVIPHLTIYGDVKPEQLHKSAGERLVGRFKELSGFRSSTSTALVEHKPTASESRLMDLSKQLVNTNLKGETTRKALYEASG